VTEVARHLGCGLDPVEAHLVADRPTGEEFEGLHGLASWKPLRAMTDPALTRAVAAADPDVIHLHGGVLVSALALAPAFRDRPMVASVYQLLPVPRRELALSDWRDARQSSLRPSRIVGSRVVGLGLMRRLLATGRVSAVCTPDPRVAAAFGAWGPVVMAQGAANPTPRRAVWSDRPVVGFAGRAEPGRGVEELVEAVRMLRNRRPAVRLRLLLLPGPAAQRWSRAWGHEPWIELSIGVRGDLAGDLASCQVVALPFRIPATITPPLVAAEAMAAGVPVVANDLSCITPMLEEGVNGAVARRGSAGEIAAAIERVIAEPAQWAALSAGAVATIEDRWSWAAAAAAIGRAYRLAIVTRREAGVGAAHGAAATEPTATQPTATRPSVIHLLDHHAATRPALSPPALSPPALSPPALSPVGLSGHGPV
jgi:glycosyltransferase involved in cell wall biosynthesis